MSDVKNLDYYRNLPYGITLRKDEEGDWVARVEELHGCTAHGGTSAEALQNLEEVKTAWIEDAIEAGDTIPEPRIEERLPSGKWLQRVPKSLHKSLTEMAEKEGVSLNQLVTSVLAEATGRCNMGHVVAVSGTIEAKAWNTLAANWYSKQCETWEIDPHKPLEFVIDMLSSPMLSMPNQINENHFRVTERAGKKELSYKS